MFAKNATVDGILANKIQIVECYSLPLLAWFNLQEVSTSNRRIFESFLKLKTSAILHSDIFYWRDRNIQFSIGGVLFHFQSKWMLGRHLSGLFFEKINTHRGLLTEWCLLVISRTNLFSVPTYGDMKMLQWGREFDMYEGTSNVACCTF